VITRARAQTDCQLCNSKKYLNIDNLTALSGIYCSATAIHASCTATINNCDQYVCQSSDGTQGCAQCQSGYRPATAVMTDFATQCDDDSTQSITGCDVYNPMVTGGLTCRKCATGKIATYDQKLCATLTASNCKR